MNDLFIMDGIQSINARDAILREIISNSLEHRYYRNDYIAKKVIEEDRILVENGIALMGLVHRACKHLSIPKES